jgi:putative RNA 2'-phosphotransferase
MNDIKLSKYLSFLLRHSPESIEIKIDNQGYVEVDELIKKVNETPKYKGKLNKEILDRIVATDNKGRYSYNENGTKIRAVQGHSFHVEVATESMPPTFLYHGTSQCAYEIIKEEGIKKITRDYVHLSKDIDTAFTVGLRHATNEDEVIIILVNTEEMIKDGYKFYVAENGVWLSDYIPPQYISVYSTT